MSLIFAYVAGCLYYVYRYRGVARYENFSEYVRKGWPIFTPFNCLLYLFTRNYAQKPIINAVDFPELKPVLDNWQTIAEEARELYKKGYFSATNKEGSGAYYDLGFRTFYKYGWSKFYLTWYGHTHNSAQNLCPKTVKLLESVPLINGAMFSLLPTGSKLTRHLDPLACSLRFHLGLMTPNSDACHINIDGVDYSWRDGQPLIFDETYLHHAKNDAPTDRLILMCDIDRPMFIVGGIINFFYKGLARLTVVPNLEGDKRGLVNLIFSGLSPVIRKTKALKQTNKALYLLIKHTVNLLLLLIVVGILAGILQVFGHFTS